MANDLNSVILIGNLVRDLGSTERDFGYTQSGVARGTISIASNRSKKDASGQWVDEVSYFDIQIWGKTAENLKPYLVKGQKVAVEGVLKQERWTDQQGNNKSRIVINALNVQLVGGKKEGVQQTLQNQSSYAQQYQNQQNGYQQGGRPQFTPQNQPAPQNFNGQPFPEDVPSGGDDYPSDIPF